MCLLMRTEACIVLGLKCVPLVPASSRAAAAVNWTVLGMSPGAVAAVIKSLHSTEDGHSLCAVETAENKAAERVAPLRVCTKPCIVCTYN